MIDVKDSIKFAKIKLCGLNKEEGVQIEPKVNLYVKVCNKCNAKCPFCIYHNDIDTSFDIKGLKDTVEYLRDNNLLSKVQITGGEPTCEPMLLDIVKVLRELLPHTFIGINTNGSNERMLREIAPYLSNIAISRHTVLDKENERIFRTKVMTTDELKTFISDIGSNKVHLSCTLMKSYIGDRETIKNYLDYAISISCFDVGLVSLMPCNKFAQKEQVLFEDIEIEKIKGVCKVREWSNKQEGKEVCCCANYVYYKLLSLYARYAKVSGECVGQLVYDINGLYNGFKRE